jgi:hypothetical protein
MVNGQWMTYKDTIVIKKLAILFAFGLMCGAADAAPKKVELVNDLACDKLANFAKSLATLKEVGFTMDGTKQFVVEPTVSPYPVKVVRMKIYAKDQTPEEVYSEFYGKCFLLTYDVTIKLLMEEEALYAENADMKAQIEALVAENAAIMNRVTTKQVKK